eukprot:6182093-Pleurochrysis_carterae.AAC.4
MAYLGGLDDGPGLKPGCVEEGLPGTASLCRAPPAAARLELSRRRPLAVAVERPKGDAAEELIPVFAMEAQDLAADGFVPGRQQCQVRDKHCLQLDVCFKPHAFQQREVEGHAAGVVPFEREVPNYAAGPFVHFRPADSSERCRANALGTWRWSRIAAGSVSVARSHASNFAAADGRRRSMAEEGQWSDRVASLLAL